MLKNTKSLTLSRETLRLLTDEDQGFIQGGAVPRTKDDACFTSSSATHSVRNTRPVECC